MKDISHLPLWVQDTLNQLDSSAFADSVLSFSEVYDAFTASVSDVADISFQQTLSMGLLHNYVDHVSGPADSAAWADALVSYSAIEADTGLLSTAINQAEIYDSSTHFIMDALSANGVIQDASVESYLIDAYTAIFSSYVALAYNA